MPGATTTGPLSEPGSATADVTIREKLKEQDWLTTVVEQEADTTGAHVTGAMIDFVKPYDIAALLDTLSEPRIRIVSLTVTEGGYYISPATQHFDPTHPDIALRRTACGRSEDGLRAHRRRAQAPSRRRRCAVHGDVLRQHSGQRPRHRECGRRFGGACRSRTRALDSRQRRLSQFDGRPHHASDQRP